MQEFGISFQSDKSLATYEALARLVARYEFRTISVYQDLFFQPPWPALMEFAKAHRGEGLVGPAVVNPYLSHPVLVAGNLALVDEASSGRAYLGMGRGAFFDDIELEQPRPVRAIREAVALTQHFLQGKRERFDGEIFHATERAYLRCPIPARSLPVMVGGWGPMTVRLAGEIADFLKVGGNANPDSIAHFHKLLAEGAQRVGRDTRNHRTKLIYGTVTLVDENRARAERAARREVAMYIGVVGRMDPTFKVDQQELDAVEDAMRVSDVVRAGDALSEETLRRFCCYGTPDDICEQMRVLSDAGLDLFEFGTPHGVDEAEGIRLLGDAVLPQLR